jgi:hypothetical protein
MCYATEDAKYDVLGTETPFGLLIRLFTTSLVVTTISFTMCSDPLTSRLRAVLVPLLWFFDLL